MIYEPIKIMIIEERGGHGSPGSAHTILMCRLWGGEVMDIHNPFPLFSGGVKESLLLTWS